MPPPKLYVPPAPGMPAPASQGRTTLNNLPSAKPISGPTQGRLWENHNDASVSGVSLLHICY